MGRRRRKGEETPASWEAGSIRLFAQLGIRVPADLALRLKRFCQRTGQSVNKTVAEALDEYLARRER